ncbi:TolB family protein [Micromonospora arida]|uniref:TolB family protein n=1 Tax=Micromonospora arida TaxID=2203715 RepID=UPI0034084257
MRLTGGRLRRSAVVGLALGLVALGAPAATAANSVALGAPAATAANSTVADGAAGGGAVTGSTVGVVPSRVRDPWLWQATVGQRPAGPAALVFFTDRTRYFESTGVLVARDGAYRLIPIGIAEGHGLLSPDGRHYLRPQSGELLDLTTGRQRRTLKPGLHPFAWSPDGRSVLGTRSNDDPVISYGPDNQQLNDPEKPDDLLVVDPYQGTEQVVAAGTFAAHNGAAWSPGGDLVAVTGPPDVPAQLAERQRLVVVDPAGGGPRWQVDLGDRRTLAGPAAWHPDGRRLALLAFDGCAGPRCTAEQAAARTWRIEFLDTATGQAVGPALPAGTLASGIIGWRGDDPILRYVSATEQDTDRQAFLAALSPDGGREVLVTTPVGSTDLMVPGDLLTRAAFGGPEPRPSPFAAPLWVYLTLGVPTLLAIALLVRRIRRHRGATVPAPA